MVIVNFSVEFEGNKSITVHPKHGITFDQGTTLTTTEMNLIRELYELSKKFETHFTVLPNYNGSQITKHPGGVVISNSMDMKDR